MQESSLLFLLLTSIIIVAIVAKRLSIPYPIAFVFAGGLLALIPGSHTIRVDPNWIFLIFLPPLLYSGGWMTDWKVFKKNLRPIGLLAIGLVIVTTAAVGIVAHALIPQMGWAAAFTLGAIVSPPDAVAAGAVFERFSVPARIVAILDGEGLVNDAVALVIYRFALAAVLTGVFSPLKATGSFFIVAVGGAGLGLAFGWLLVRIAVGLRKFDLSDYLIDTAMQLVAPYAIYLSGEIIGVSGVLATVTASIYVSRQSGKIYDPEGRLVSFAVWDTLIFLLNGLVFLLIGLQLRSIIADPSFALQELWVGLTISALVIVVRIAWVYFATYIPRFAFSSINRSEGKPNWKYIFILGWSGMRGIVSLAGALALPEHLPGGAPFPARPEILFITFCVIFITLVFQGLTLIPILKFLKVDGDDDLDRREIEVRVAALRAGIERMRKLEPTFDSTEAWEVESRILGEYEYRIAHLTGHLDGTIDEADLSYDHKLQKEALKAERKEIARLRDVGDIPDEIYRRVQYDLDLASERMN
jgi:CPA1 family monovalent cation:H+ antiporter